MRYQILAAHPAQSVLELHELDENVVLGINLGRMHRRLEVERQPFLDSAHACAMRQIEKQHEVEHQWRSQDRVAAEEVYFDLHRIAEPSEDIDIVPSLLGIAARWIVIDPHFVEEVAVKLRIHFRLKSLSEHR